MDKIKFDKHRYLGLLDKGINQGISQFFLHGKALNDYAYLNTHLGIRNLEQTLMFYFLDVIRVDVFAVVSNGRVLFYDRTKKQKSVEDIFSVSKKRKGLGTKIDTATADSQEAEKQAENATEQYSDSKFINDLLLIQKNYDKIKMAIFFDEFEWSAGLYGNEQNLDLIKMVRNWSKTKQSYTVIAIKNSDLLKEFDFNIELELPDLIYISSPSQSEISNAYRRFLFKNNPEIEIVEEDFSDITSGLQAGKKSLREAMRVLKKILTQTIPSNRLSKELFENSLHKAIEEKVTFDDVILDKEIKDLIIRKIKSFNESTEYASKGMILYGPPGTGKTYIAKAIAHELNMNYMAPTLAELKGEYIGQTSGKVKRLFEDASKFSDSAVSR